MPGCVLVSRVHTEGARAGFGFLRLFIFNQAAPFCGRSLGISICGNLSDVRDLIIFREGEANVCDHYCAKTVEAHLRARIIAGCDSRCAHQFEMINVPKKFLAKSNDFTLYSDYYPTKTQVVNALDTSELQDGDPRQCVELCSNDPSCNFFYSFALNVTNTS